jgi:hypothetical protein
MACAGLSSLAPACTVRSISEPQLVDAYRSAAAAGDMLLARARRPAPNRAHLYFLLHPAAARACKSAVEQLLPTAVKVL